MALDNPEQRLGAGVIPLSPSGSDDRNKKMEASLQTSQFDGSSEQMTLDSLFVDCTIPLSDEDLDWPYLFDPFTEE